MARWESMNPNEQPEDDPERLPRAPFVPPEAWIEAFDAQCTDRMIKALRRYAGSWARFLGGDAGNDYAEELVQTALTDTACGVLRWDPAAGELEPYLIMVIRLRARRDRKSAARHEHVFIDAIDSDDAAFADLEASLAVDPARTMVSAEKADALMDWKIAELRALAPSDQDVQRFLDAIDQGAITKPQIMRLTGLTKTEFSNVRRRLARLVVQLTPRQAPSTEEG